MTSTTHIAGFLAGLMPAPRIDVSEWACTYRYLTSDISPEPGLYRVSRTPYLRAIMDDLSPYSPVEEVDFMKSNQVGATQAGNNWLGAIMHLYNGPTLMVLPTEQLAKRNSKMSIDSMIDSTPVLRERIAPSRDRDSGNTLLEKKFPGGFLAICGANSPNNARSTAFRFVYLDELSAYPEDMGGEGDPYELFHGRTKSFGSKRKVFSTSTPTTEGECGITKRIEGSDKRRYFIPCPHCGEKQWLDPDRLRWTEEQGIFTDVYYECVNSCQIEERYKPYFLAEENGAGWIPTDLTKINPARKGYLINALYSPLGWFSWVDFAKKAHEAAKAGGNKTHTNLDRGETWKIIEDAPDYKRLVERAGGYDDGVIPPGVAVLTAGVDVQKNRIEVEVLGWASNKCTYSIDYKVFEGDTDKTDVWYKLRDYLNTDLSRKDGVKLPISFTCIDSGYQAHIVYEFCKKFGNSRCVPVKGVDNQTITVGNPRSVNIVRNGRKSGTTMYYPLGVSVLKENFYSRLNLDIDYDAGEVPMGYCYFPLNRSVYYYKGLCSEVYQVIGNKGQWVKVEARNEPLDLRIYATAAGQLQGVAAKDDEWFTKQMELLEPSQQPFVKTRARERRKSDFWDRGR